MTPEELQSFYERLVTLQEKFAAMSARYPTYTVLTEQDLSTISVSPPAMAFVLEEGEFYFLHGPEFWFGNVGTNGNDREDNKWIKAPYSGMRALLLSSDIAIEAEQARLALASITQTGPYAYDDVHFKKYGGTYNTAIENLLEVIRNSHFLELNTKIDATGGELLYEARNGDIDLDSDLSSDNVYCVQDRSVTTPPKKMYGYDLELLATQPLRVTTPGLHLHNKVVKAHLNEVHGERLGYAVTSNYVPRGTKELPVKVYPNSLPKLKYNSNPKQWIDTRTVEHVTRTHEGFTQEWDRIHSTLSAPTNETPGNWLFSGGSWAVFDVPQPYVRVLSVSWNNPGQSWPDGAEVTITLETPCPIPLIWPQGLMCIDPQPYWNDIAPVRSAFFFDPLDTYGGYLNATTIHGRIRPVSTQARFGEAGPYPIPAGSKVDLYNPATENWGGLTTHSPARGMREGDYISEEENNTFYRVTKVFKNALENPETMVLNKTTHLLKDYDTNIYGISIGGKYSFYPDVTNPRNTVYLAPFITVTGLIETGFPMLVEGMRGSKLVLSAPIPMDLPINTRINLYSAKDADVVTYAYSDPWEYMHKLDTYNVATFDITKNKIQEEIDSLDAMLRDLQIAKAEAERRAYRVWTSPPYNVLVPLAELYWPPKFDILIEDEGNPDKYGEAFTNGIARRTQLIELRNSGNPPVTQTEYLSILDYDRRGLA